MPKKDEWILTHLRRFNADIPTADIPTLATNGTRTTFAHFAFFWFLELPSVDNLDQFQLVISQVCRRWP